LIQKVKALLIPKIAIGNLKTFPEQPLLLRFEEEPVQ
jgi:hypothetical protein